MAKKETFKRALIQKQEGIDAFGRKVTQRVEVVNEVVDGYVDVKLPQKHRFNNGGFITLFQYSLLKIVEEGNLSKNEFKVLLWLIATAGIDGSVVTNLDILSESLKIAKTNISTALKGLVKRNIVIRQDLSRYDRSPLSMNLTISYDQINYNLAFNGKTKEFTDKQKSHPAIELQNEEKNWININTGEVTPGENILSPDIPFEE